MQRPCHLAIDGKALVYLAELWRPAEPGQGSFVHGPGDIGPTGAGVGLLPGRHRRRAVGHLNHRSLRPRQLQRPARHLPRLPGDLYVAEVTYTFGIHPGRVSETCAGHQIQKFMRVR